MKKILSALILFVVISSSTLVYAETKVCFSPNGGCQQEVISAIKRAQKTIDIAMYSFTSRDIAYALVEAKKRNVKIKLVLDNAQIKEAYSKSRFLIKKGFSVKFHMGPALMHDKFAVIDDHEILTGSYNWSVSADKKNAENLLIILDKKLAQKYEKQFKIIWSQSGEGQTKDDKNAE